MKGKFIVLDGLDGSGKGTQVKLLANYFFDSNKKNHIFLTREPYNSEHYEEIRKLLKSGLNPRDNAERLAELFVADRRVHAALIESLLSQGIDVVSDRYKYSTLAYQQTQGISLQKLIDMHKGILIPDLTLIIDTLAEIALERIIKDEGREYKEVFEQKDFQEKLRENYLAFSEQLADEKIIVIDGNKSIAKVFESIKKEVEKIL
ncbi:dTMP kinase [Candidatus Wolfebacteria bacterium CG_4_10_14_0_8_um_filter_37_11]|uniref:Thymidylate kinase n=1 Tax=Candidatus Wolfebacteria bacterium CG_4_10_14_0_8_um_filter_37_11 TaxID=1975062 RepID=A0A2M7Q8H2_9BACT|nr:MAG: dTMP kinase [Candidatus Wolfebacteria bacterium CG_4_10_14_0_8_um_filter_37_11]